MRLQQANNKQIEMIYELYMEAFPEDERKPFEMIQQKTEEGKMEILAIDEAGEFKGLAISIFYKDLVLIDYFAISAECRGQGIGGKAIELLKERYSDRRMFLEVEVIDEKAENNAERIRRKAFYHNHGLRDAKIYVSLFGVEMELLTVDCRISYDEYYSTYFETFGEYVAGNIYQLA